MENKNVPIVSTDGHCGAPLMGYRDYLDSRYHDEFDVWVDAYVDAWADIDSDFPDRDPDLRPGAASASTSLNWDSDRRRQLTDDQGVAAEVLFPNTSPPFIPSGSISAAAPRTPREFELRFAGLVAHNRWLAEFCQELPGRRAGLAQIFLDDVDAAVTEIRRAHASGLTGVLLPSDHTLKLVNLYYPELDAVWATCAELDMPVHRHVVLPMEAPSVIGFGGMWAATLEIPFYNSRALLHMICSAVFERFPSLKFVVTESSTASSIPAVLAQADAIYHSKEDSVLNFQAAVSKLSKPPTEYFASNCYLGGPLDMLESINASVPNLMFGADIPHAEGTAPYTQEAVRIALGHLPVEQMEQIAWRTAAEVYGLDPTLLQEVADEVGPPLEVVQTPLEQERRPRYPKDSRSRIFAETAAPVKNSDYAFGRL